MINNETYVNKVVFSQNPSDCSPAVQQTLTDAIKFSEQAGFRSILFGSSPKELPIHYLKLISSWLSADVFVTIYPWFCRNGVSNDNPFRGWDDFLFRLLNRLKRKNKTILFIYDLPIEQGLLRQAQLYDSKSYELECQILRCFDILCVFNRNMREVIRDRYNLANEKFVEFECTDYGIRPKGERRSAHEGRGNLFYIGNGDKYYAGEWMIRLRQVDYVRYEFLGSNWERISDLKRDDFTSRFLTTQQEVCDYMHANADFGIITYADKQNSYSNYGCPSKFGAYVTAGVPILVSTDCAYITSLVEKYGIGLSFDSFQQIPELIKALSDSEYERMRESCQRLAEKLYTGYFFKRALAESLRKLHVQ